MELNNNISIEQFAAFLDGNLPEDEMQAVATAIDSTVEYSDILGDAMLVDDAVDEYMNQSDVYDVLPDTDFDLPIIPELVKTSDVIELAYINDTESDTVEFQKDDVNIMMASGEVESTANNYCHYEAQLEHHSSCGTFDMEQQTEDVNDFTDLV